MKIEIDNNSGFCFGVMRATSTAESELEKKQPLYCLGDIVHNGQEVERLTRLGLITIDHTQLATLQNARVLLRAHGEPPHTYEIARQNGIKIIDATCPVVLKLQQKIKQAYTTHPDAQIVIYGKIGHAEVIGLEGQTEGKAIVIEDENDLSKILQKFYGENGGMEIAHETVKYLIDLAENMARYNKDELPYEYVCWKNIMLDVVPKKPECNLELKSLM